MKRISLLFAVAVLAFAAMASSAMASTFKGAVVGRDAARGAIAVASASGSVRTVRVQHLRSLGARVTVHATRRPDGTFRATRVAANGRSARATVHGVVVRHTSSRTFLSAGGSVLSVRGLARLRPGRVVTVGVSFAKNGLHGTKVLAAGSATVIQVEGTVASLSPLKITLERGSTIQLTVPAALTLPAGLAVGDEVEAIVAFENDVYTLVTLQDDDRAEAGDDDDDDRNEVEFKGTVTAVNSTALTVKPRSGDPVTFAVPGGFDLSGIHVGSLVEVKGVDRAGTLTLVRVHLEDQADDEDGDGEDHHDGNHGDGGHGGDGHGGHHHGDGDGD